MNLRLPVADARLLADAERGLGETPDGCAWLDARTSEDLDLPLVFAAVDRTVTPTGAQALWRWLSAPAVEPRVVEARTAAIAAMSDPQARERVRSVLQKRGPVSSDASALPRLLWSITTPRVNMQLVIGLWLALAAVLVLSFTVMPKLILFAALILGVNMLVDDWSNRTLAQAARGIVVLAMQLDAIDRIAACDATPAALREELAAELAAVSGLRRRVRLLVLNDPFQILDMLRAVFLVRLATLASCARIVESERPRLRRLVLQIGELDAAAAICTLRADRDDARIPVVTAGPAVIEAHDLVHPAVANAIGNEVALAGGGLVITGSNMSGKSTFLRALAINAVCAQSIATTFGDWRSGMFRVFAVMRIADDTAAGASKYAVEVAAIGEVVDASHKDMGDAGALPALIIVDEPFGGTNPAVRVPIVVSVLGYLAERDLVIAATHDLEVAAQLGDNFQRGYFAELAGTADEFDRKLRPGVSPGTNAVELLERAGYPAAILADVSRRVALTR